MRKRSASKISDSVQVAYVNYDDDNSLASALRGSAVTYHNASIQPRRSISGCILAKAISQ